jgi:hypothetical protein
VAIQLEPCGARNCAVSALTECLAAELTPAATTLRAAVFYPSGGLPDTGLFNPARNRPAELARAQAYPKGAEVSFEELAAQLEERMGLELRSRISTSLPSTSSRASGGATSSS